MARLAPLEQASLPTATHENALRLATLDVDWVTLSDIKLSLGLELSDTFEDSRLANCRVQAIAVLEKMTGRSFSTKSRVAEYAGVGSIYSIYYPVCVLAVDEPDAVVSAVKRVDNEGNETLVPSTDYTIAYRHGKPHVRLNPQVDEFRLPVNNGVYAIVEYDIAMSKDSREAQVARALVLELVEFDYHGVERGLMDPRQRPAFKRNLVALQNMSGVREVLRAGS